MCVCVTNQGDTLLRRHKTKLTRDPGESHKQRTATVDDVVVVAVADAVVVVVVAGPYVRALC